MLKSSQHRAIKFSLTYKVIEAKIADQVTIYDNIFFYNNPFFFYCTHIFFITNIAQVSLFHLASLAPSTNLFIIFEL